MPGAVNDALRVDDTAPLVPSLRTVELFAELFLPDPFVGPLRGATFVAMMIVPFSV